MHWIISGTLKEQSNEIDSLGYQTPGKLTHQGIRSLKDWLTGVSDPGEIDSPGYQIPERLTHRGIRSRRDWLTGVSDPGKIDSPGYQVPGRLESPIQNWKYLNPSVRGEGRFDLWKKWRSKILLDCPFKRKGPWDEATKECWAGEYTSGLFGVCTKKKNTKNFKTFLSSHRRPHKGIKLSLQIFYKQTTGEWENFINKQRWCGRILLTNNRGVGEFYKQTGMVWENFINKQRGSRRIL